MSTDLTTDPLPTGVVPRRSRRKWVAVAVILLVVLALTALGLRWWTHPTVLSGLGDSFRSTPRPVENAALSTTFVFSEDSGDPETITIKDLGARFSPDSAPADATFFVCHPGPDESPFLTADDPASQCADIDPVSAGSQFRYGDGPEGDYLFVTVVPERRGVVHLESVEIEYRRDAGHLYQQGTQSIRVDRKVPAT